MISYHIRTALARERHDTLLAEAEAARRARQARPHRQRAGATVGRRSWLYRTPHGCVPTWQPTARSPAAVRAAG